MALPQIKTFKDIQDAIIVRGKMNDNTTNRTNIKVKINTAQKRLAVEKPYDWSGMTRPLLLKAKYTTGTIAVTNGSNTITGTSTVWTELEHLNWKFQIGGNDAPYQVKRVASNTSITIDAPYLGSTDTGLSYTLFKDEYGLYPDLHEVRHLKIPSYRFRLYPRGMHYVDERRSNRPFFGGLPRMFTVHGKKVYVAKTWANFLIGTDFWEDTVDSEEPQDKQLIIYPAILTNDRLAFIRYTRVPPVMNADDDIPLVPFEWRKILVLKVLVEEFLQKRDIVTKREWEKEYKEMHMEMQSDVESTDEDTRIVVDRSDNRFQTSWSDHDELDI